MEKKERDYKDVFESMEHLSSMTFKEFEDILKEQQKGYTNNLNYLMDISTAFGKNLMDTMREESGEYKEIEDIWSDFTEMSEEMMKTEEATGEDFYEDFTEYNKKVTEKLNKMIESNYEDARELYASWIKLTESVIGGIKAGTGPDPDEITEAIADFQQTAVHLSVEEIENLNDDLNTLRTTVEELNEKTSERMNEMMKNTNERYREQMDNWLDNLRAVQDNIDKYTRKIEENYKKMMEPFFEKYTVMPLFPWFSDRRFTEYENEVEELKKKIVELEEKLE